MKHLLTLIVLLSLFPISAARADVKIGQTPPGVELKGDAGGRLDGTPWSSQELKGKVHVLFYVDPDEKDLNNDASEALDKEKFPSEKFASVAVINMAATWLPNFMISSSLEEKQKRYPRTLYVRDLRKALVRTWKIADDNSDVLAFDKEGRLIFRKDGKLGAEEIRQLLTVIKENL
jgi:YtfJ family uncharacterized protein